MRFVRRLLTGGLVAAALALIGIGLANYHVLTANRDRLYETVASVPACDVGLVLGTSAWQSAGRPNPHFERRMDAAAGLYRAGKVRHLLVSGDNRHASYNEPVMMRRALVERGVPVTAITCDFAGFRTLDSVVRAQQVFGLDRCVIITQRYHNSRALEIARAHGLDAYGYCAPAVDWRNSFRTECREVVARAVTVLDLYAWNRAPRFLGRAEPIRLAGP